MYLKIRTKFILALLFTTLWTVICTWIEIPWYHDLCLRMPPVCAIAIIAGLAFFPGIMICLTISGILLDKPRRRKIIEEELEPITILVAAYNEEAGIYDTIKSISLQEYPNEVYVKVIDNNSKDNTKNEILKAKEDFKNINVEYVFEGKQGKFAALNNGLSTTTTRFVITVDGDCWLYKNALVNIVNAMVQENKNKIVAAMAGTVLVKNSRVNILTKMQEWEYFLSIAGIKRMQGLFQSTLVAQGAFSIYDTEKMKAINGWPDSIGEDIVVTWNLLGQGYKSYYVDDAVAFTNAPTKLKIFLRQRKRWARGMIEGFKHFSFKNCSNPYATFMIFCDIFLFIIDIANCIFFIPGTILAVFFHDYLIVGPTTLIMFPITMLLYLTMHLSERNRVFKLLGLKVRKHWLSFICYCFAYSYLLSPVCLAGYLEEFVGARRKWR